MVNYDDYKKSDGRIDWNAVELAEIEMGDRCMRCRTTLFPLCVRGNGSAEYVTKKRLCGQCRSIDTDQEELVHDKFIRCPYCGTTTDVVDRAQFDAEYECFGDGDHTHTCEECNKDFEFTTHVSYSFTSPAVVKNT